MTLQDPDKRFLDRTDWRIACVLAFGVACWAMMFGLPCPHPDFWTDFSAAARIRPARSMLDAFWLFPAGLAFDLLGVDRALSVCGLAGRAMLGLMCGGVYLCLRGFWYEFVNYEAPEVPTGFWNARFGSFAGALIFCLCTFTWKGAQFASPDFAATLSGVIVCLLWQRARHSRGMFCLSMAYATCGAMAAARPPMLLLAAGFIICDMRERQRRMFMELKQDEGEAMMLADQREVAATGVALSFGVALGIGMCLASAYRFAIVPDANLWNLFDVWFGSWGDLLAYMFASPGVVALVLFVGLVFTVLPAGRNMRMTPSGGLVLRNIFLVLMLLATLTLGLRRMTGGNDGRKLSAIRQYVGVLSESCRGEVSWLFTDGAFDDLIRLEMRERGVRTKVMSLTAAPTDEEAAAFRDYAPEKMDRDTFAAGGSEVFRYWSKERKDRLDQSAWLIGSGTVRKYDADALIRVVGGVFRHGVTTNANESVEGEMTRLVATVEQVAQARVSQLEHSDGGIQESFCQLLRRLAGLAEERRLGHEREGDIILARREQERVRYYEGIATAMGEGNWTAQTVERLRPTANLVLTPQEGLWVALRREDWELATRFAQSVLVANPTNVQAHFAIGMAHMEVGGYAQAAWHFAEVVRQDPEDAAAQGRLAVAHLRLGHRDRAEESARAALKMDANSKDARDVLAELAEKRDGGAE